MSHEAGDDGQTKQRHNRSSSSSRSRAARRDSISSRAATSSGTSSSTVRSEEVGRTAQAVAPVPVVSGVDGSGSTDRAGGPETVTVYILTKAPRLRRCRRVLTLYTRNRCLSCCNARAKAAYLEVCQRVSAATARARPWNLPRSARSSSKV